MARSVLITRRDWVAQQNVTASGGAWLTPFETLTDPRPKVVYQARSPDPDDTWFTVDLGVQRNNVGLFSFQQFGVTSLGVMRLRAGVDPTFATTTYDTGLVSAWPQDKAPFSITPWGELTVNGVYEPEEYEVLGLPRFFVPPSPIIARYLKVEISDSTASVPARIGNFGAFETWAPLHGVAPDYKIDVVDETGVDTASNGAKYFTPRSRRRRLNIGFTAVPDVELMEKVLGWVAYVGRSTPLVISLFPDDTPNLEKRAVWGTLIDDPVAIESPYYATHQLAVTVEQLI